MTTINGHTLFPHNGWAAGGPLGYKRRWQTGVATGITGAEQRAALRAAPRHELTCSYVAATLQERSRLDARIDQAKKSGLGCLPFFGRACSLAADAAAGANSITIAANPAWTWAIGDYVIFVQDDLTFDCLPVTNVAGAVLTLAGNLGYAWPAASSNVWPLLFGAFSAKAQEAISDWYGKIEVTISQLIAERNAQLGVTPAVPPGVGQQAVGSTNVIG